MATSPTPRKRSSSTKSASATKSTSAAKSGRTKSATTKSASAKSRSTARAKKVAAEPPKERQTVPEAVETPVKSVNSGDGGGGRTVSFTVPSFDRVANGAANAAMLPVAVARQVLPAKRGLPVYLGLGVLGVADVIEWPVAIGLGVGYAFLRRTGVMPQGTPGFQGAGRAPRAA
ncbi:hypothetical protein ACIRNI_05975 [Streptomyces sp. NPDC093546]|uniref:hypothetical protein n=1 Tax=Streptomyces sp. NPDC093546 TaxID=3366040 RepID=UPI00380534BE